MNHRKVYRYLEKLSIVEWREFKAYLDCPLLGNSELYGRFLEVFRTMKFEGASYTPSAFHERIYPKDQFPEYYDGELSGGEGLALPIREAHMKRHLTGLLGKLFDFWGFKQYQADAGGMCVYRLQGLAKHADASTFEKEFERQTEITSKSTFRNGSRLLDMATLALLRTEIDDGLLAKKSTHPFQLAIDQLDEAYILAGLELGCMAMNHDLRNSGKAPHTLPRFLEVSRLKESVEENTLSLILSELYKMYLAENGPHVHYEKAKKALIASIHLRNSGNSRMFEDLFVHLINFARRQHTSFPARYQDELHELYGFALQHGVFLRDGYLSRHHYQNIATLFIRVESYTWVAQFLEDYKQRLPPHLQEPLYHFNLAALQFAQSDFRNAWRSLFKVENNYHPSENVEFTMQFKAYQLVMEYEIGELELLNYRALRFIAWLKAELGLPKERVSVYLQFAKTIKKLGKLRIDWDSHPKPLKLSLLLEEVRKMEEIGSLTNKQSLTQ